MAVVRLQHVSIPMPSDGHARAREFYAEILGMPEIPHPVSLGRDSVVWFDAGGDGQEVHCFVHEPFVPGCVEAHLCLQVDDLEETRTRLASHGVTPDETIVIRNRPRYFLTDPFGNKVEIVQVLGQYE